ncbi:MAG: sigma-70 family RNA polymerase sigma factor [Gemmataceae bacterium]|nr:sigma-70 family RNA polymerase sigma factor [Gemmataceae bacterium]
MPSGQLTRVVSHLRRLVAGEPACEVTDGQLLERFVNLHEQSAFEALLQRHGAMVHGVCRRILNDAHDVDDAFQAIFLILVRKGGSIGRKDSIGSWLYRVAFHVALRAKARADRRRSQERQVEDMASASDSSETNWSDLRPVLDEELNRLPEKYRAPMVLCYLEGKTQEEAAAHLRWPAGTVRGRLARARDLLRERLTRRGLALSAVSLSALLEANAMAAVPVPLFDITLKSAAAVVAGKASGLSAPVAALVEGGLNKMFLTKLKIAAAVLLCVGVSVGAMALTRNQTALADKQPVKADDPAKKPVAGKPADGDVFGYSAAFDEEVKKIGQISPEEFGKRYGSKAKYAEKMTWDPTTAKFYSEFQKDPKTIEPNKSPKFGRYDFRMDEQELAKFKENGFVVSERMGADSFGEAFYRIYIRDLPVYVSADAILHAWHRSYDAMLEELEETYLAGSLDEILSGMAAGIPQAKKEYGDGILKDSLSDADYFIAVARSLLAGQQVKTNLDQEARVTQTLKSCDALQMEKFELFGREREMDFSQFKVRGHYENSELLKKYFKSMMWCGRTDMRIAGGKDYQYGELSAARELGSALVLLDLIKKAGKMQQWQQFDQMIQTFVGKTDSATFAHLDGVFTKAGIKSPAEVKHLTTLQDVQKEILAGNIGMQHVRGDIYTAPPFGPEKVQLPRSFTVLGQKFVVDSWVTAKVVYSDVIWDEEKVMRRVPSCLDVAFAALGNDQVVPDLVGRMNNTQGRKFRDGLNYQHNLAAVRNVIDAQDKAVWDENLYMNWLGTVRELSQPTTDAKYPEAMRSRAWAMKTVNTQLASWAQLRHDTILYVKQSYTDRAGCYYPAGYVEPLPHFWARLEKMANKAGDLMEKTPYPDRIVTKKVNDRFEQKISVKDLQKKHATFFRNFAKQVVTLKEIAVKELDQKPLTAVETKFLEDVMQIQRGSGFTRYNGWYPKLFYKGDDESGKWDAIVADVHTDVPNPQIGDPGCVLHQGVGNVDMMLIAIDNGTDKMVYAGPVMSHYEFEMSGVARKSDSEWRKDIREGKLPPRPEWTKSYLVPGVNPNAKNYFHENDPRR